MRCKRTRPKLGDDDDDDTFKKEVSPARMSGGKNALVRAGPALGKRRGACLWGIEAAHKAQDALRVPPGTEGHFWRGVARLI